MNIIIYIVLGILFFVVALLISMAVIVYHLLGLKDILNAMATMNGEMWDDLSENK